MNKSEATEKFILLQEELDEAMKRQDLHKVIEIQQKQIMLLNKMDWQTVKKYRTEK